MAELARVMGAILFLALLHSSDPAFGALDPATNRVNLAWDKSIDTSVIGYRVFFGLASGDYPNSIEVGNETSMTVSDLTRGATYFFAVASICESGVLSEFSNEITYEPILPDPTGRLTTDQRGVVAVTGTAGNQYDILATQNFATWTVVGTVTLGVSGMLDFTDPDTEKYSGRFYRIEPKP